MYLKDNENMVPNISQTMHQALQIVEIEGCFTTFDP